jgi:hypothetical protein
LSDNAAYADPFESAYTTGTVEKPVGPWKCYEETTGSPQERLPTQEPFALGGACSCAHKPDRGAAKW